MLFICWNWGCRTSEVWHYSYLFGRLCLKPAVRKILLLQIVVRLIWNLSENGSESFQLQAIFLKACLLKPLLKFIVYHFCSIFSISCFQAGDFLGKCFFKCCGSCILSCTSYKMILIFISGLLFSETCWFQTVTLSCSSLCCKKLSSYLFSGLEAWWKMNCVCLLQRL